MNVVSLVDERTLSALGLRPPRVRHEDPEHPFVASLDLHGLAIDLEHLKGQYREGVSPEGVAWRTKMPAHYGEVRGTCGADGDAVDVYVGPNRFARHVYVIQAKLPGSDAFDETKSMVGFDTREDAISTFRRAYDKPGFYLDCKTWPFPAWREAMARPHVHGGKMDAPLAKGVRFLLNLAKALIHPRGAGWEAIPNGKHGGYRRRKGSGWEHWYPPDQAAAAQHHHAELSRHHAELARQPLPPEDERYRYALRPEEDEEAYQKRQHRMVHEEVFPELKEKRRQKHAAHHTRLSQEHAAAAEAAGKVAESGKNTTETYTDDETNPHRGQRTLGPEEGKVHAVAADLTAHLEPAEDGKIRLPMGHVAETEVQVRRTDGSLIKFPVRMDAASNASRDFHGGWTPAEPDENGNVPDPPGEIYITARSHHGHDPEEFREKLRSVLSHEIAHAMDITTRYRRPEDAPRTPRQYINQPQEIAGNRHQIFRELQTPQAVAFLARYRQEHPGSNPTERALALMESHSPTWPKIRDHMRKKTRRAFLEMLGTVVSKLEEEHSAPMVKAHRDRLPGGKADQRGPEDFDPHELARGTEHELEHTKDRKLAQEIAMDHLAEDPRYYRKLQKVEKGTRFFLDLRKAQAIRALVSAHDIGDPVFVRFENEGKMVQFEGHVRAITFSSGKVKYAVVTANGSSTFHGVDSVWVEPWYGGQPVDFSFDNYMG